MKSCPQCGKQYPDSETFCEADGSTLIAGGMQAGRVTTVMPSEERPGGLGELECPVCGGKAQPGELICNFCGARLPSVSGLAESGSMRPDSGNLAGTGTHLGPQEFGDEPASVPQKEEQTPGRRLVSIVGFSVAALVALAAGAWLALYLAGNHQTTPLTKATPALASTAPFVDLAKDVPVRAQSDQPGIAALDNKSLVQAFADNKPALINVYSNALNSDASMRDGMVVRLHLLQDGRVDNGAVRLSTSGNPSFDAEVIQAMTSWKFPSPGGNGMSADYEIIFATRASDASRVESDLNTRLAALSPSESPEYAFAPSGASGTSLASPSAIPTVAVEGSLGISALPSAPAAAPTEVAGIPPASPDFSGPAVAPPEARPRPRHRRPPPRALAALPPPKPPLITRVNEELKSSRKLRRVHAYTNGSVVTIFGKVFDKDDSLLAERTVRNLDGVSSVINNVGTDVDDWARNQDLANQALQNAGFTNVTVKVIGKDAYLGGQVKSELDRERAATIVQTAAPVTVRENLITVALGNMLGF